MRGVMMRILQSNRKLMNLPLKLEKNPRRNARVTRKSRAVASEAEAQLTAEARAALRELLGEQHLADLANDLDTLRELMGVLKDHQETYGADASFNMLFAGSATLPRVGMEHVERVVLPDLAVDEAVTALCEYADEGDLAKIGLASALVGGVPALLHAVGFDDADGETNICRLEEADDDGDKFT